MSGERQCLLALAAALVLTVSGLVAASSMGLMVRLDLSTTESDYWLSLPYRTALSSAQDLCDVIGPHASLVAFFDTDAEARIEWACPGGTNFALEAGRGVIVQVSAPTTVTFLGAHDPDVIVPPGGFTHADRDYLVSLPYHSTAATANDVCDQIPAARLISRFDTATGVTQDWTCPFGINFSLRAGEALRVQVSESGEGFVPGHF